MKKTDKKKLEALTNIQNEFSRGEGKIFEIFSKYAPSMFHEKNSKG